MFDRPKAKPIGGVRVLTCSGHSRPVRNVCYSRLLSSNDFFFVSSSLDSLSQIRYGRTGDWLGSFEGHKGAVWHASISADSTRVATASADYTAGVFDAINGKLLQKLAHSRRVRCTEFQRQRLDLLATGCADGGLRIFDLRSNLADAQMHANVAQTDMIRCINWQVDDHRIFASAAETATVVVFDARNGLAAPLASIDVAAPPTDIADDDEILCIAAGNRALFYDSKSLELRFSFGACKEESATTTTTKTTTTTTTTALTISSVATCRSATSDGRIVCGFSDDLGVNVYKYSDLMSELKQQKEAGAEAKELLAPPPPFERFNVHHGPVHCVRFAPDYQTFATASEDGTVRLFLIEPKNYGLFVLT